MRPSPKQQAFARSPKGERSMLQLPLRLWRRRGRDF
eukprot:CAMPEP_0174707524 /NCGR_PEP_ID=MMETSP1094-20130205/10018_1 /TAXON_ID=156173 /ORGANISM="Chrysochromulina brevifilum, Strain UTEX LB 985" /LENGTH=35 /DNA_ID= /DNA_START= /DNA_END= /DNA_ORIENTATION=